MVGAFCPSGAFSVNDFSTLEGHWRAAAERASRPARAVLSRLAETHAVEFADAFYDVLLRDPDTRDFLSNEKVNDRLHAALRRWIAELLSTWDDARVTELIALQRHVAAVHARQKIQLNHVLRGARLIKDAIVGRLRESDIPETVRFEASALASRVIDLSMEGMSAQYEIAHDTAVRTDENYRTYAASANLAVERERLRSALFEWENRFLQQAMIATADVTIPTLGQSSFGLWITHKSPALFADAAELAELLESMDYIDTSLLPLCQREIRSGVSSFDLRRRVTAVNNTTKKILALCDLLFDSLGHFENGRDALTQVLSRRFLPTILTREVTLSRRANKPFSVLMLDLDNFKNINDRFGHLAGDRVLQHFASIVQSCVRSGDFVFRYGGEEFLVICVELSAEQSLKVAEKIRRTVEAEAVSVAAGASLKFTVSVGVAAHDGHPDYLKLIERADAALYRAKNEGKNRSVLSE